MRITLIFFLLIPLLSAACVAQAPTKTADNFRALLDEDWKYWMTQYPEAATLIGYPGQDARWTDYRREAIEARNTYLRKSAERVRGVDRAQLDPANQLNYDLYLDLLQTAVQGLEFDNDAMPVRSVIPHNLAMPINQLEGITQDIPRIIASARQRRLPTTRTGSSVSKASPRSSIRRLRSCAMGSGAA